MYGSYSLAELLAGKKLLRPVEIFGAKSHHDFRDLLGADKFSDGVDEDRRAIQQHELLSAGAFFFGRASPHARTQPGRGNDDGNFHVLAGAWAVERWQPKFPRTYIILARAALSYDRTRMSTTAEKIEIASDSDLGSLGVAHLKRFWSRYMAHRRAAAPPDEGNNEWAADNTIICGLGLNLHETMRFIYSKGPSFEQFEQWIVGLNGGSIDPEAIGRIK